jgi:hypothetical protein
MPLVSPEAFPEEYDIQYDNFIAFSFFFLLVSEVT